MGRTHALSGAVGWLAGCAALGLAGHPVQGHVAVAGAVVSAGAALLPDLDHPKATASISLGSVTGGVSWVTAAVSRWVSRVTCSCCDGDADGHRALTHTVAFAVLLGVLLGVAGWRWGAAAGVPVVAVSAALACRGLLSPRRRRGGYGVLVVAVAVGAVLAEGGPGWWWIGLPVAWGMIAHCLGDAATLSACPLLWPLRVRGCRWGVVGSPRWLRFRTGGPGERVVWCLLMLLGLGSGAYLVFG
ncbi:metal-dependent hydrolase [Verrucosispora sp. WMMC514]|uniref:metal-dependent hydrolase n=1 Tax=Verrucosispora sp. WMMC514 TaxID=3015156 RepID=UPI00248C5BE1|nr:metal-dependent hydrolase [Verrucosispora sp. WMMC514]WBB94156.1 metal-dependent hydrolase [Verrucosispora sp. WMMC514]